MSVPQLTDVGTVTDGSGRVRFLKQFSMAFLVLMLAAVVISAEVRFFFHSHRLTERSGTNLTLGSLRGWTKCMVSTVDPQGFVFNGMGKCEGDLHNLKRWRLWNFQSSHIIIFMFQNQTFQKQNTVLPSHHPTYIELLSVYIREASTNVRWVQTTG